MAPSPTVAMLQHGLQTRISQAASAVNEGAILDKTCRLVQASSRTAQKRSRPSSASLSGDSGFNGCVGSHRRALFCTGNPETCLLRPSEDAKPCLVNSSAGEILRHGGLSFSFNHAPPVRSWKIQKTPLRGPPMKPSAFPHPRDRP